ncbi:DUF805 domain-containing protein [Intestinirhabdus alba]|jgi:uncharacterized membrane protein YhaH (DUF805 family)|uniref:DUF805 domain-containing protein n=1 Tax=Intestinirhabdus alba TaxID=2899544 RepID=A0A6L6IG45_9ENTR|nr:DUF805 domain-containing protein [Intestinirhabdus alba]MTH45771.1 DUF805 domain-containing protein [Intestinirhabdus alba]
MQWYLHVLKNYAGFSGRARRQEYWMFTLINCIVAAVLNVIQGIIGLEFPYITIIYVLATLVPAIAVGVRRLHDTDRSGFMMFLHFIPLVGSIILLVFFCKAGTEGENKYGPDPKGSVAS